MFSDVIGEEFEMNSQNTPFVLKCLIIYNITKDGMRFLGTIFFSFKF